MRSPCVLLRFFCATILLACSMCGSADNREDDGQAVHVDVDTPHVLAADGGAGCNPVPGTIVKVCGTLSQNTTWTPANVFDVTCTLTVPVGVSLTIQPGTIVKFEIGTGLVVNGTLNAKGTAAQRIYFTSIRDDSVGGDTNGDGAATSPAVANWTSLQIGDGAAVTLDYATLRYSGYNLHAVLYAAAYTVPTLVSSNVVLQSNWVNGIELPGGSLSKPSYVFRDQPSVAYFVRGTITVPAGVSLTINPGAVVKFDIGTGLVVNGALNAKGTAAKKIYLTSIRDDSVDGDTNNDNAATSPAPANWTSLQISGGAAVTLDYATLRYSGYNLHAVLYAAAYTVPTLVSSNVVLQSNWVNGIELPGGSLSKPSYVFRDQPSVAYFVRGTITVPAGVSLTINPGAVLKFDIGTGLVVSGALNAQGTAAQKIYLTSIRDDSVDGDTNNDNAATSPAPANWDRVSVAGGAAVLSYLTVRYAGYSNNGALSVNNGTLGVTSACLMTNRTGLVANTVGASITGSSIFGNTNYGVYTTVASPLLIATNNWWGAASGPAPGGTGDQVTSGVSFTPFQTSPALACP